MDEVCPRCEPYWHGDRDVRYKVCRRCADRLALYESIPRSCPHVRQDLTCTCSAGDERPNTEHHIDCGRQGKRCRTDCDPEFMAEWGW